MKKKINLHLAIRSPQGPEQHVILKPKRKARYLFGHKVSGNTKGADIQVADETVSRKHCEIKWLQRKGWVLNNLGSENITFLNGERVTRQDKIKRDSAVLIGDTRILITVGDKKSAEKTPEPSEMSDDHEGNDDTVVADEIEPIAVGTDSSNLRLEIQTADGRSDNIILTAKDNAEYVIGRRLSRRNEDIDIAIPDKHISRRHCKISWYRNDGWSVLDLDTTNGTFLNGVLTTGQTFLADGNELLLAMTTIILHIGPSQGHEGARILSAGSTANDAHELDVDQTQSEITATEEIDQTLILTAEDQVMDGNDEKNDHADAATALVLPTKTDELARISNRRSATINELKDTVVNLDDGNVVNELDRLTTGDKTADVSPASKTAIDLQDILSGPGQLLGITQELVDAHLLDAPLAQRLILLAQDNGQTIFRALAENEEVRFKAEIYDKVSTSLDLPLMIEEKELERENIFVDWIPINVSEELGILALEPRTDSTFRYATIDPYDIRLDDWIRRHVSGRLEKVMATPDAFFPVVNRLKNRVSEEDAGEIGLAINITSDQERLLRSNIADVDIPQMVNYFIHRGFVQGASDVHIEPTEEGLLARNRIDGVLHEDSNLPATLHSEVVSRIKIMSGMDVAEKRRPQDGRIGLVIRGTPIDVRVSTYPTVYGEKVVMRLLDKSALRPSPEALGLLAGGLRALKDKINAPHGLIMISGPTGSGKTTTLYSCLGSIDKNAKNVLTIEDPVEYRLKGVHQMQVNEKIGLTFSSGLRTILRQDPDVIMIGECRDLDTAAMAIQASLTGHIVFSTIHTNDSIGVITRLLDMKIDPFLVSNALSLCVAQRLVRRVCKHCSTTVVGGQVLDELHQDGVSDKRLASLQIEINPDMVYVTGAGCIHCNNTGYLGRQAVFEVFEMTSSARTMIMSPHFNADELRESAIEAGMVSVVNHGLHLVDEGITTHQEVLRVLGEST